jgi:hypothetical protein
MGRAVTTFQSQKKQMETHQTGEKKFAYKYLRELFDSLLPYYFYEITVTHIKFFLKEQWHRIHVIFRAVHQFYVTETVS